MAHTIDSTVEQRQRTNSATALATLDTKDKMSNHTVYLKALVQLLNLLFALLTLALIGSSLLAICDYAHFEQFFALETLAQHEHASVTTLLICAVLAVAFGLADLCVVAYGIYHVWHEHAVQTRMYAITLLSLQIFGLFGLMKMGYIGSIFMAIVFRCTLVCLAYHLSTRFARNMQHMQYFVI